MRASRLSSCSDSLGARSAAAPGHDPRELLVAEYRRLFDLYRAQGVIINFHSCGHIQPLLETFIDLGIHVLNPVQASANDLAEVRRVSQGRLVLLGGLSSGLLVDGPSARIRDEVQRLCRLLGRDGGYFCASDQGMPWPPKTLCPACLDALNEYGRYAR